LVKDDSAAPAATPEQQAVLKEDGLLRSESRGVVAGSAKAGWMTAYEFGDATGAYSAYTYFRGGANRMRQYKLFNSTEVQLPDDEIVFLSGTSVVRAQVRGYPETEALLRGVEVGLPKPGGRRSLAPLLPTMLPTDVAGTKLELTSLRYAIGPVGYQAMGGMLPNEILGWDKSAEIATANYTARNGSKGTLTVFLYPTPQIAGDRGRAIQKAINDAGGSGAAAKFGTVAMRRVGQLLGMTSGGLSVEQAKQLVEALHLNEEISYDRPMPLDFHIEVQKTATLLQRILIFTGTLVIAALVIAVFLGGARAGWRVMHGKPAASEPEFLTIDLRDQPKGLFAPKEPGAGEPRA
jgi:hypothetical protein